MPQQSSTAIARNRWQYSFWLAAFSLILFIGYLLLSNYLAQTNMRDKALSRIHQNILGRAEAVGYFCVERRNDLEELATGKIVNAYFSNKALGMSLAYGLKGSLNNIVRQFQHLNETTLLNKKNIYNRLILYDLDGSVLAEYQTTNSLKPAAQCEESLIEIRKSTSPSLFLDPHNPNHLLVGCQVRQRSRTVGYLLGWVDLSIIHNQFLSTSQPANFIDQLDYIAINSPSGMVYQPSFANHPHDFQVEYSFSPAKSGFNKVHESREIHQFSDIAQDRFLVVSTISNGFNHKLLAIKAVVPEWDIELIRFIEVSRVINPKGPVNLLITLVMIGVVVMTVIFITLRHSTRSQVLGARLAESSRKQLEISAVNQELKKEIEQRRQTEIALANEKSLISGILDTIPDLIFHKNQDSIYQGCNKAFASFLGKNEDQIHDMNDFDFFNTDTAIRFQDQDRQVLADAESVQSEEWVSYPDGRRVLLDTVKTPFCSTAGNVLGLIGVSRDITARKNMELELIKTRDSLRQANETLEIRVQERTRKLKEMHSQMVMQEKMASIGQLAAGIAHELNNPINYVHTNFATLMEDVNDLNEVLTIYRNFVNEKSDTFSTEIAGIKKKEDELRIDFIVDDLKDIFNESEEGFKRISRIITSMRDFSHVGQDDEKVLFDINKGLEDTLIIARNIYKYHAKLNLDLADLPQTRCLPEQLNQVFLNLIVNSAQALAESDQDEPGVINVRSWYDENDIYCEISDNGPGIAEDILPRIFEPFYTTKDVGKGTGLGLSISYDIIVNRHNGKITVLNSPKGGAVFNIQLPITNGD